MTENLPAVCPQPLVVIDPPEHDDPDRVRAFEEQIAKIQSDIDQIESDRVRIATACQKMMAWFEESSPEEMAEVIRLRAEVTSILLEQQAQREEENKKRAEEEIRRSERRQERERFSSAPEEADPPKSSKEEKRLKKRCKEVYATIAKTCHPDKTSDDRLTAIFIKAAIAYRKLDLSTLRELLQEVRYGAVRKLKELEATYQRLIDRLQMVIGARQALLSDPVTDLLVLYNEEALTKQGHQGTLCVFRYQIVPQMKQALQEQLATLRPPEPVFVVLKSRSFNPGSSTTYSWNFDNFRFL
jgi:hypothetical protein